ncbi:hypothetical protein ABZ865_27035 [Streptomyces sp. NPDC047085]|uniref:hypothetical protein n=1 Tax=Streptomyces sp. NPDC047085 TaxID=3155140 RepID=UPI00340E1976
MNGIPYVTEADVDAYGFLYGGEESLSVDLTSHRWSDPYPPVRKALEFSWEAGELGRKPNIFKHNLLRDVVCDELALNALRSIAGRDVHVYARASLDGEELSVVQATTVLDIVDETRSIPSPYSWARVSFPHISREKGERVRRRVFRVANPELSLLVLIGDQVKAEIEAQQVRGWSFERAWVDLDQPEERGA